MKKLIYICIVVALSACTNNKQQTAQSYTPTPTGLEGIRATNVGNATATTNQANSNSSALNPAHGAPGHRCDIAVGAPLNTGSSQATNQQITTTQQAALGAQMPTVTTNTNGQKLNPAHGEPNHRCDIAVGAPLNSAPAQAITPAQNTVIQSMPQNADKQPKTPMFNEKGQRLNPAHGEPMHKCEIAVGAVLI